jgi:hypothetical protein
MPAAENWLKWLQHESLLTNCRLLDVLLEQLRTEHQPAHSTISGIIPGQHSHQPTMLGGIGWQQLIAQCFSDTPEDISVMSKT